MRIIDLATLSLVGGSGIAEAKIPLWWADGTYVNYNGTSSGFFIADGSTTAQSNNTLSQNKLFALSSNWPSSLKYALELSVWSNGTSYTASSELWDMTSNTAISGSLITTISATATVLRSNQFTLTPGHQYGITLWSSGGSTSIADASLIIFPS